jgi:hypothetical protein
VSSPRESKAEDELTSSDWVAAVVASLGTMFCCEVALSIGPRFKKLFEGFGGEMPVLTQLVCMPWFPLLFGLTSACMVAVALVGKTSLGFRRGLIVGASFISLSASALCLHGLYIPIFAIADAIK